jgi:two-component system chemotaxis response regulator CheB
MPKIRILIVDDSSVARRMTANALRRHDEIEVVAAAKSGTAALAILSDVAPDALILDVEMPELDGIKTLALLRKTHPQLPVIMFSALTERGARATLDALAAGASDYVAKPSALGGQTLDGVVSELLVPKILALAGTRGGAPRETTAPPVVPATEERLRARSAPVEIVAIASSTGGPNALAAIVPQLPASLLVPIVIVQHMPPVFTRCLAERLDASSVLRVREAQGGEALEPGSVWVAQGDRHLEVASTARGIETVLTQAEPENSCRPAADVLFRSVAKAYGRGVLGVVLTGMGQDGLRGAHEIVGRGGTVISQSRKSCVVWGMPRAVEEAGLVDATFDLSDLAAEIRRRVEGGTRPGLPAQEGR